MESDTLTILQALAQTQAADLACGYIGSSVETGKWNKT
jgi:hypothetical protein